MTAGFFSENHQLNSAEDNRSSHNNGMASNSNHQYQIPPELQEVLLDFTVQYLIEQPDDLTEFAYHYFSRLKRKKDQECDHRSDESMISEEDQDDGANLKSYNGIRRKSVFAEAYNPEEDDDDEKQVILHPKTDEQRRTLTNAVANILLFSSLDSDQLNEVIDAMFQKDVQSGENVITQGADGDNFYIIESGVFETFLDGRELKVSTYNNSGSFGELALMYNMPRAATIKAVKSGVLWALDRNTFRRIVLKSAFQKRKKYETLLESVKMLQYLSPYERMNLADALASKAYNDGAVVLREGDPGDKMYFVEEGEVSIIKKGDDGAEKKLDSLSKGQYFGELALVTKKTRAATVYANGKVKLAVLEVSAFERLLGPCMDAMEGNIVGYSDQVSRVFGGDTAKNDDKSRKKK